MKLLQLVFQHYRWPFLGVVFLSLVSAALGIGVIGFINHYLIENQSDPLSVLPQFALLILALMAITLASQLTLTILGHHFVFALRRKLIKQIMDTDLQKIDSIGTAKLQASLTSDIRNITLAFVRLPELIQGIILTLGSIWYLSTLSLSLLAMTAIWVVVTIVGGWYLVSHVYRHLDLIRHAEDKLHADYLAILEGRKELSLNRSRAKHIYHEEFEQHALEYRHHIIRADTFHLSAINWSNIMMLSTIGMVFFLANTLSWANTNIAATFSLTLLFLRTPLLQAVGALPTLLSAEVAFEKINQHQLKPYQADFDIAPVADDWQTIELKDIRFDYPSTADQEGFQVGPFSLTIRRGEQLFLIGGNGSGKTTLAMLCTGLYSPTAGKILLDGQEITTDRRQQYQQLFSAVFTNFHQFSQVLGPNGEKPNSALVEAWLHRLNMKKKLQFSGDVVTNPQLSQGQKKRLALLLAIAEERPILLLDEWAADQDPQFRRFFYQDILPHLQSMQKTVIAISHDDHYFDQADRLLEMRQGQLLELTGDARIRATQDAIAHLAS